MFSTDNELLNAVWSEKHRPKTIDDIILNDDQKKTMRECLEKKEIPHTLLAGPPGGGKTTLARILIDYLIENESDLYMMNGSDSTGVENVRQNIIGFLKTPPFVSKFKIVFIDEMDYMSNNAQAILRDVMQSYCDTGRFVCTCNYLSKILGPLQSRFSSGLYEMKTLSKDYIFNFAEKVLKAEGVEYDKDSVDLIISACVPDVRKVINTLQKNTIDRKLKKVDINTIISNEKKITGFFIQIMEDCCTTRRDATVNNNIPQILQLLSDSLDYKSVYQTLFFHEKLPLWSKIKVNQYMNTMESCAVPSAHLMACVYDSLQAGMVYNSMITKK